MDDAHAGMSTLSRFHRRGPYAAHVIEHRSAGRAPVRLLTSAKPAGVYAFPPTADLALGLCLRGGHDVEYDFGAGRWRGRNRSGNFSLLAPSAGAAVVSTAVDGQPLLARTLFLAVPAAALRPALADAGACWADFGRLHAAPFRDPFLEALCRRLWDEAAAGNPNGRLFADGAVPVLAAVLLRLAQDARGGGPAYGHSPVCRRSNCGACAISWGSA